MHGVFTGLFRDETKIAGITDSALEENFRSRVVVEFRPGLFGEFAKLVYPEKPDVVLAGIGKVTDRAARAWMSGNAMPPPIVIFIMVADLIRQAFR